MYVKEFYIYVKETHRQRAILVPQKSKQRLSLISNVTFVWFICGSLLYFSFACFRVSFTGLFCRSPLQVCLWFICGPFMFVYFACLDMPMFVFACLDMYYLWAFYVCLFCMSRHAIFHVSVCVGLFCRSLLHVSLCLHLFWRSLLHVWVSFVGLFCRVLLGFLCRSLLWVSFSFTCDSSHDEIEAPLTPGTSFLEQVLRVCVCLCLCICLCIYIYICTHTHTHK